jgi:P-type E1-E2 ATPase
VATPVALWAATTRLGEHGVVVRRLGALEDLARVGTVVFDKTGTLTELLPVPSWRDAPPRLRGWVAAVQAWSRHPVAVALRGATAPSVEVHDVRELPGGGLAARVVDGGASATIEVRPTLDGPVGAPGARQVEVCVDGRTVVEVDLVERPVPEAETLVAELGARAVSVEILTGDGVDPGLGVSCRTRQSPAAKLARIRELQGLRAVAFVGDASNDLPALAGADVSVAVRGACTAVSERVDVVIPTASALLPLLDAARATTRRLRLLVGGSLAANVAGVAVAAAGALHPVLAGLLMAGSSLAVTLAASPGGARAR